MKFTFPNTDLRKVVSQAFQYWPETNKLYHEEDEQPPSLWLVGDNGVYIMSNAKLDVLPVVCYANECNPETMDFDDWYEVKREDYGGDDGADNLCIHSETLDAILKENIDIEVELSGDKSSMTIHIVKVK